jgi:hypothetical protein
VPIVQDVYVMYPCSLSPVVSSPCWVRVSSSPLPCTELASPVVDVDVNVMPLVQQCLFYILTPSLSPIPNPQSPTPSFIVRHHPLFKHAQLPPAGWHGPVSLRYPRCPRCQHPSTSSAMPGGPVTALYSQTHACRGPSRTEE